MLRVFICYRRTDSAGHAGRLSDALTDHFGNEQVYMDIDTIDPGMDFRSVIDATLDNTDVVIAVIGRDWLDSTDARGRRRLDNPDDFVRLELEAALQRNKWVIPVLIQGAKMPRASELPSGLAALAQRQALELADTRWHHGVEALIGSLERMAEEGAEAPAATERADESEAAVPVVAPVAIRGHAFVSYASEDRDQVIAFVGRLRERSVPIWIDEGDIDAALLWSEVIVEAIEQCGALVVMLSEAAAVSSNVVRELVLASEYAKPIVPLLLEPMEVPRTMRYQLAGIQRINLYEHNEDENLLRVLRSLGHFGLPSGPSPVAG